MKSCPLCKKSKRLFQICVEQHFTCVDCIVKYDDKIAKEHRPCPICKQPFDRPLMANKLNLDIQIQNTSIKFTRKGKTLFALRVNRTKGKDVDKYEYDRCSQYIEDYVIQEILQVLYQFQTLDNLTIQDLVLNIGKAKAILDDQLSLNVVWVLLKQNNGISLNITIQNKKSRKTRNSSKSKSQRTVKSRKSSR